MPASLDVYYSITDFALLGDHTLRLTFSDGSHRTIDFEPVLYGPVFHPLRDPALFRQVRLNEDTGTIEWPTGADFNPVVLHDWPEYRDQIGKAMRQPVCGAVEA